MRCGFVLGRAWTSVGVFHTGNERHGGRETREVQGPKRVALQLFAGQAELMQALSARRCSNSTWSGTAEDCCWTSSSVVQLLTIWDSVLNNASTAH